MSASAAVTPTSWHPGQGLLGHSAYDPALSFAYTSVSGARGASTIITSGASLGVASIGGTLVSNTAAGCIILINEHPLPKLHR
jgi:hypothetical protein